MNTRVQSLVYGAFLAMIVGVTHALGRAQAFGLEFPAVMAIVQFNDPAVLLSLVMALVAMQFVIGNFLDPYLMGNSLDLSPFAILVSLAIWSESWGVPGVFLAVPITATRVIALSVGAPRHAADCRAAVTQGPAVTAAGNHVWCASRRCGARA